MSLFQSLGIMSLYVGFDNYHVVLSDPLFLTSIRNNLVLMACVPIMIVVALILALLLNSAKLPPLPLHSLHAVHHLDHCLRDRVQRHADQERRAQSNARCGWARLSPSGLAG